MVGLLQPLVHVYWSNAKLLFWNELYSKPKLSFTTVVMCKWLYCLLLDMAPFKTSPGTIPFPKAPGNKFSNVLGEYWCCPCKRVSSFEKDLWVQWLFEWPTACPRGCVQISCSMTAQSSVQQHLHNANSSASQWVVKRWHQIIFSSNWHGFL